LPAAGRKWVRFAAYSLPPPENAQKRLIRHRRQSRTAHPLPAAGRKWVCFAVSYRRGHRKMHKNDQFVTRPAPFRAQLRLFPAVPQTGSDGQPHKKTGSIRLLPRSIGTAIHKN